jgi:hypothetical protein
MSDTLTARMVVGMVNVHCPACAEAIPVDVRLRSLETDNGSYVTVNFQTETPAHSCVGRRA